MIKIGMVGPGGQGRILLDALAKSKKMVVSAAVSPLADEAAMVRKTYDIPVFHSLPELLSGAQVDAVIISSPPSLHASQVQLAAAAGKHIFVEKPLGLDSASAAKAVESSSKAKVVLAVGFQRRFYPAMIELRRIVAEGVLGTILHVEGQFSHNKSRTPVPGSWRAQPQENPKLARGMIANGIHALDAMVSLCGEVSEAYSIGTKRVPGEYKDTISAQLKFRSGATGTFITLLGTPLMWRVQALGTQAWAEVRDYTTLTLRDKNDVTHTTTFPTVDVEQIELEAFADAILGTAPYPIAAQEALNVVAATESVLNSMDTDRPAEARKGASE